MSFWYNKKNKYYLSVFIYLCIISFIVRFYFFQKFGIYEDDNWFVLYNYSLNLNGVISRICKVLSEWPQGRPLNHISPIIFVYVGKMLGGLKVIYLLSSIWLGLNSWLLFVITKKYLNLSTSLVIAIAYILFPSDTTRQLIHVAAHVQGSITFTLLAWYLWINNKHHKVFSYVISTLCLLSYEPTYLPFIFIPLLFTNYDKNKIYIFIKHLFICIFTLVTIGIIRYLIGESRAVNVLDSPHVLLWRGFTSIFIGPLTDLKSLYLAIHLLHSPYFLNIILTLVILLLYFIYKKNKNDRYLNLIPTLIGSILMLGGSYIFSFVNYFIN
jgi:hypothetical protein